MITRLDVDLLVVGGGLQGLSILHEIERRRPGAHLLVSRDPLGTGETLHSHGYLHRGYSLPEEAAERIPHLVESFDWWTDWMARNGIAYGARSPIVFDLPQARVETTTRLWSAAGLPFELLDELPGPLAGGSYERASGRRLVGIHDRLIEPWRIVETFARPLQGSILRGELVRMDRDADTGRITSCEVAGGEHTIRIRPRAVVLATGRDTQRLLRPLSPLRTAHRIREVPMVLIRGAGLPELSGWFSLDAPIGLMCHGSAEGQRTWVATLMEGHRSSREDFSPADAEVDPAVARKTMEILSRMVPALRELAPGLRYASYVGTKIDHPDGSSAAYVSDAGLPNLRLVWPVLWASARRTSRLLVDELIGSGPLAGPARPRRSLADSGLTPGVEPGEEHRRSASLRWHDFEAWRDLLEGTS